MANCWDNRNKSGRLKCDETQKISQVPGLNIKNDPDYIPTGFSDISTCQQIAEQRQQMEVVEDNLMHSADESKTEIWDQGPSESHPKKKVLNLDEDQPAKPKSIETTKQSNFPFFTDPLTPTTIENEESLVHNGYVIMESGRDSLKNKDVHRVSSYNVTCSPTELEYLPAPPREALDCRCNTNASNQTIKNTEKMGVQGKKSCDAILHKIKQQKKRKAGRPFKKKTLMKMAKLLAVAQELDTEEKESSKRNAILRRLVKPKSSTNASVDIAESVSDNTISDKMNVTSTSGKRQNCHEKEISTTNYNNTFSMSEIAVSETVIKLNKKHKAQRNCRTKNSGICKTEKDSLNSKVSAIDLTSSTNIQDVPVLRPVALSVEGLLELAADQQDQTEPIKCDTEIKKDPAMCATTAATNIKDPPGFREVVKLKRKAGRPFKKKTLIKIAKRSSITQEGDSTCIPQCPITDQDAPLSLSDVPSVPPLKSVNSSGVSLRASPPTESRGTTVTETNKKIRRKKRVMLKKNVKHTKKCTVTTDLCSPQCMPNTATLWSVTNDQCLIKPSKTVGKNTSMARVDAQVEVDPNQLHNISTPTVQTVPSLKQQKPCKHEENCNIEYDKFSNQTVPNIVPIESGLLNHSTPLEASVLMLRDSAEVAASHETISSLKTSRALIRPLTESKKDPVSFNLFISEEMEISCTPVSGIHIDLIRAAEELTCVNRDPHKPSKPVKQRIKIGKKNTNTYIPNETRNSNSDSPLDQHMESEKPNFLPNEVQIKSDELYAIPTKWSKVKICRKRKLPMKDLIENPKRDSSMALLPSREKELDVLKTGEQAGAVSLVANNVLTTDHESDKVIETPKKLKKKAENCFTSDHEAFVTLDSPLERSASMYGGSQEIKSESNSVCVSSIKVSKTVKKRSTTCKHNTENNNLLTVSPSLPPNVVEKESERCRTQNKSKPLIAVGKTNHCKNVTEQKAPLECLSAFVQDMFCDNTAIEKKINEEKGDVRKTDSITKQKMKFDVGERNVLMDSDIRALNSSKGCSSESQATLLQRHQTVKGLQKTCKGLDSEPTGVSLVGEHKWVDPVADNPFIEPLTNPKEETIRKRSNNKRKFKTEKPNGDTRCTTSKDILSASMEKSLQINSVMKYRDRKKVKALKEELTVAALFQGKKELPDIVPKDANRITNVQTENPQNHLEVKGKRNCKTLNHEPIFSKSHCSSSKIKEVVSNINVPLIVPVGDDLPVDLQFDGKNKSTAVKKKCPLVEKDKKRNPNLEVNLKASTTKTSQDVKKLGKGKKKYKKTKQKVNVVTGPEDIITIPSGVGFEENIKTEEDKKCRTAGGKLPAAVTINKETFLRDKLPKVPQNQIGGLSGGTQKNRKGKTRCNKSCKTVVEVITEPTLNEKAVEKEDKFLCKGKTTDFLRGSCEPPTTNVKRLRQTKCKSIKESVNTAVVHVTKPSLIDATKSKRRADHSSKKKPLMKMTNQLSDELQEEHHKTAIQRNQKPKIKAKITSKTGEGNETVSSTTPLRRGVVRSCNSAKTKLTVFNDNVSISTDIVYNANSLVNTNQISSKQANKARSNIDLNCIKQEQESLQINVKDFKVTNEASASSIFPISEPPAERTHVSKNRRKNPKGWDSKNKSKPPRDYFINSDTVNVSPHYSLDNSGLSFSSSSSHSLLDNEIISLKIKDEIEHVNCHQPSNVLVNEEKINVENKKRQTSERFIVEKNMTFGLPIEDIQLKHSSVSRRNLKSRKPIPCYFCGRSFRHISAYTVHKRIHTGEKPYRCLECGKCFAQLSKLYLHSNIHKEPQVKQCPCCVSRFPSKDKLITHFNIHIRGNKESTLNKSNVKEVSIPTPKKTPQLVSPACHTDFRGLNCPTCYKQFFTKATLNMHLQTQCVAKPYTCNVCGKKFCKSSSLNVHEKTHWPVKPYACSVCGKGFAKLRKLKSHSQLHSGDMPFFCNNCDQAFNTLPLLRTHQVSKVCYEKSNDDGNKDGVEGFVVTQGVEGKIYSPMYFKCQICKQLYSYWCQYVLHLPMHTESRPYLCEICGQQYDQVPQTLVHCKVCCKSSGEQRACNSCLSEILREPETGPTPTPTPQIHLESLSNEDQEMSPPEEQVDQCLDLICSPHLETVEEEMAHVPSKCLNTDDLSLSSNLNQSPDSMVAGAITTSPTPLSCISEQPGPQPPRIHSRSTFQSQYARYSCRQCGKSFNQWNKLWLHQGGHNQKDRLFSCPECHSAFRFFGSYMNHMKEHTCNRPYPCPLCPETFVIEENLRSHICEHHKPREILNCRICGKNFTSLTNLKRHRLLHTGTRSHFCFTCNQSFTCSAALENHLKDHKMRSQVPVPTGTSEPLLFPYNCKNCKAKFTRTDLLEAHQVYHFAAGRKPTSSRAKIVSTFPNFKSSKKYQKLGISESLQQIPSLPVTKRKHLFRYPNPDHLYVVPMVSSDPPFIISDTEEDPQEIILIDQSSPKHGMDIGLNKGCLKPTTSTLPQSPLPASPVTFHESELTQTNTSQVDRSLSLHLFDKDPLHDTAYQSQNNSTESESYSDGTDDDLIEAPTALTKQREFVNNAFKCVICRTTFVDVFKLHEHYLKHARGL